MLWSKGKCRGDSQSPVTGPDKPTSAGRLDRNQFFSNTGSNLIFLVVRVAQSRRSSVSPAITNQRTAGYVYLALELSAITPRECLRVSRHSSRTHSRKLVSCKKQLSHALLPSCSNGTSLGMTTPLVDATASAAARSQASQPSHLASPVDHFLRKL